MQNPLGCSSNSRHDWEPFSECTGRRLAKLAKAIGVVLGLSAVVCSQVFSNLAASDAQAQDTDPPTSDDARHGSMVESVEGVAKRLVAAVPSMQWTLHDVDRQPSVEVNGHRGFHIVLRRKWKEFEMAPQQQASAGPEPDAPFKWRHADWEFALFPIRSQKPPANLTSKIEWQKSNSPYHTRDVCMGEGWGYVWYTRGTIFGQEFARDKLKLRGGDDRMQLAIDGMLVADEGTMTANSCLHIAAKFGDKALPYVERTIKQSKESDDLWRVVGCLAYIRTQASTDLLLKLYDFGSNDIRRAAQYALIHQPFRKAAKRAYFDMLRRKSSVHYACQACVHYDWKDAVPILRDLVAKPRNLREFEYAIHARRTLEGNPIDQQLLDAEQTLRGLMQRERDAQIEAKIAAARALLIHSQDAEAANLAALSLATATNKGDTTLVNRVGLDILQSRPRASTVAFLKSLVEGTKDAEQPIGVGFLHTLEQAP